MADPRVCISYSHDSDAHEEAVLQLAQQLRAAGVDAQIDRFVPDPVEGWPRWMMAEVDAADLVLLVCSATYRRRFEGQETPGTGRGVTFEGMLAIQHLYDADSRNTKFIPVLFEGATDDAVPLVLRPYTRYTLPRQFDQLYRSLTDQPEVVAAPLGPRKVMPPRGTSPAGASAPPVTPVISAPTWLRPPLATEVRSAGAGDVSVTPLEALHQLLLGLFGTGEEFRRWIARGPDGARLVAEFPGVGVSTTAMVFDGLAVLSRRGHLDDDFFARLTAEFTRLDDDIARVAAVWRTRASSAIASVPAAAPVTHGGIHVGTVSGSVKIQAGGDIVAGDPKHITNAVGPAPTTAEARRALDALRRALSTSAIEQPKIGRADDVGDELAVASPERAEVAGALARVLKIVERTAPDLRAAPGVAGPLVTLGTWLGADQL